jgi:hypothetical protein
LRFSGGVIALPESPSILIFAFPKMGLISKLYLSLGLIFDGYTNYNVRLFLSIEYKDFPSGPRTILDGGSLLRMV